MASGLVRGNLEAALADAIAREELKREPIWTESLAVGCGGFVEKIKPMALSRRQTEVIEMGGRGERFARITTPLRARNSLEKRRQEAKMSP